MTQFIFKSSYSSSNRNNTKIIKNPINIFEARNNENLSFLLSQLCIVLFSIFSHDYEMPTTRKNTFHLKTTSLIAFFLIFAVPQYYLQVHFSIWGKKVCWIMSALSATIKLSTKHKMHNQEKKLECLIECDLKFRTGRNE